MTTPLPTDISLDGLNTTRSEEGRALRAYQDSVNVWTIGYGLTNYDKGLPFKIGAGLVITAEQAEWLLYKSIRENYLPAVHKALSGGTYAHPQGVVDGGVDFHFNTGGIGKASWPKKLKAGDLVGAKAALMSWNKAGGKVLAGLTRRRTRNWQEISAGTYGHLTGPAVIVRGAGTHGVAHGVGEVLITYPTDPGHNIAGNVHTDGVPTPITDGPGVLRRGTTGEVVSEAQRDLTSAGYAVPMTGSYDDDTVAAVEAFQGAHPNLTKDGKYGPATRATVQRAIAMRGAAGVIVKAAVPAVPGAFIVFHQFVGAHAGMLALWTGLAITAAVAGFYIIRHRTDLTAWINGMIGRTVT